MTAKRPTHRCPVCRLEHGEPRASNVTRVLLLSLVIIALEVTIALALTGWLAIATWVLVAYNVTRIVFLVHGLATLAVKADR